MDPRDDVAFASIPAPFVHGAFRPGLNGISIFYIGAVQIKLLTLKIKFES